MAARHRRLDLERQRRRRCSASRTSPASLAGAALRKMIKAKGGQSRYDAIVHAAQGDTGGGIAYQMQYAFRRRSGGEKMCGWRTPAAGLPAPDGKPLRAHGVVRDDNGPARARPSAHATGALRSAHRRDESRLLDRSARRHARRGGALSLVLRLSAGGHRQSRSAQRILRLRRRRAGDRQSRQAHSRAAARQGSSRPLLRQQVRRDPDQLHAGRVGRLPPIGCWPACAKSRCSPTPARSR